MNTYNVCWSGGVDSTFIVTQLSQYPVVIRPFYIRGQTFRTSEPQELSAIESISRILNSDSRTKAQILPIEVIEKNDSRIKNRDVINTHRSIYIRLLEKYKKNNNGKLPPAGSQQIYADGAFISPQYIACESLARYLNEPIELGFLQDDFDNIPEFKLFKLEYIDDFETSRKWVRLAEDNPDQEFYELFKDFRFPIAGQNMYKKDVWEWFVKNDYKSIRDKTIFCQEPRVCGDDLWEPCGICTACIAVIREGVLEPFTTRGMERYCDYVDNHKKDPKRFRLKNF